MCATQIVYKGEASQLALTKVLEQRVSNIATVKTRSYKTLVKEFFLLTMIAGESFQIDFREL